jgi:hypothetical protein
MFPVQTNKIFFPVLNAVTLTQRQLASKSARADLLARWRCVNVTALKPVSASDYIQVLYRLLSVQTGSTLNSKHLLNSLLSSGSSPKHDYSAILQQVIEDRNNVSIAEHRNLTGFAQELHRLPEPNRTASTLYYLGLFDQQTIAHMLQEPVEKVDSLIHRLPEKSLGQTTETANTLESIALQPDELRHLSELLESPEEEEDDDETEKHRAKPRTIMIAVGIGLLATIAMIGFLVYEQMTGFTGKDQVISLLDSADGLSESQFEKVQMDAKDLEDYFFLKHNLDHITVPKEFIKVHALGCRVFNYNGSEVAQVEATGEKPFLFYIFHSADLGIRVKHNKWAIVQGEKLIGAVTTFDNVGCILAYQGSEKDLRNILKDAGAKF